MQDNSKFILASIQDILDKNKGFIALSKLPLLMGEDFRNNLGLKPKTSVRILRKKLEPLLEDNFVLRKKGNALYILTPRDPADFVLAELSEDKPVTVKEIAKVLNPFTNADVAAIVSELVNSGRVNVVIDEKFTIRVLAAENVPEASRTMSGNSGKYTREAFREAYDEQHMFRELVRICDIRRKLNWPRDIFDQMIHTLRDDRTIQIFRADESIMTRDEVEDCFVDENKFIMGTIIWNGR